jgi:hypothetical protein
VEREEQVSVLSPANISGDFNGCETADYQTSVLMHMIITQMLSDKIQKEASETYKVNLTSIKDN